MKTSWIWIKKEKIKQKGISIEKTTKYINKHKIHCLGYVTGQPERQRDNELEKSKSELD